MPYPAGVSFRQIVVTGPPGSGKTTLVERLGGWPEEGLLDLSAPRWWASRELAARPREVHLAFPFRGLAEAVTVHDDAWRTRFSELDLALGRIQLPERPGARGWLRGAPYVFDFQLPSADELLGLRARRAAQGSHPGDQTLDRQEVERQLELYRRAADLLARAGFPVVVRLEPGGPPFALEGSAPTLPRSVPFIERLWRRLSGHGDARTVETVEPQTLRGRKLRIPRELLPVQLTLGPQRLRLDREPLFPPGSKDSNPGDSSPGDAGPEERIVLHDPDSLHRGHAFVRLAPGERTRLGRGAEDRLVTPRLPKDILPRLEIVNQPEGVLVVDLDSPTGTDLAPLPPEDEGLLLDCRRQAAAELREIVPSPDGLLAPGPARELLERVLEDLAEGPHRPKNRHGVPGGLVQLPEEITPLLLGDLHGLFDRLLCLLTWGAYLEDLRAGRTALVLLGDAVHRDRPPHLEEMTSSIQTMDCLFALMAAFPGRVLYLKGNHDSFSGEVSKGGVPQGRRWREALQRERGEDYVAAMERFYGLSPYVLEAPGLVACHAGPPLESVRRQELVEIADHPRLQHQLTWNRLRAPNNPAGYGRREVRDFLRALGQPKAQMVVSHAVPPEERPYAKDLGGIRRLHLIYSADPGGYAVATKVRGEVVLLDYPAEPFSPFTGRR